MNAVPPITVINFVGIKLVATAATVTLDTNYNQMDILAQVKNFPLKMTLDCFAISLLVVGVVKLPQLWLISTNGDGFRLGSLGQRSVPKWVQLAIRICKKLLVFCMSLYRFWIWISVPWKNFCIVQCSYQGNPPYRELSPYPSPLVEISH